MQCPICGAIAENITPAGFGGLGVRCKNCGDYKVTSDALTLLLRKQEPERVQVLAGAAEEAPEPLPTIHSRDLQAPQGPA